MKNGTIRALGAAVMMVGLAAAGQARAQQAPGTAAFEVGGVAFTVPIPAGYCLPAEGMQANLARYAASLDKDNVTDLTLVSCGAAANTQDYILVKTQATLIAMPIDRATVLAELAKAFGSAPSTVPLPGTESEMENSLSNVTGKKVEISLAIGPRGRDADCYYLGGSMEANTNAAAADASKTHMSVGSCLTAVGGRFFAVHYYAPGNDPATPPKLMARAHTFAMSIRGGTAR